MPKGSILEQSEEENLRIKVHLKMAVKIVCYVLWLSLDLQLWPIQVWIDQMLKWRLCIRHRVSIYITTHRRLDFLLNVVALMVLLTATHSSFLSTTDDEVSQSSWLWRCAERCFFTSADVCPRPVCDRSLNACPFICSAAGIAENFLV